MNTWNIVIIWGIIGSLLITFIYCLVDFLVNRRKYDSIYEMADAFPDFFTFFDEPGDEIEDKEFKVFRVITQDAALVKAKTDFDSYFGNVYLLTNQEGICYNDKEIITSTRDKEVRQVGIYYNLVFKKIPRDVPVIMIMDK